MDNTKLKILHVVPYYPPAYTFGGPVKGVYEMAHEQYRLGHNITVLTTDVLDRDHRSRLPFHKIESNIEVYRVPNINQYLAGVHNFYFSRLIFRFIKMKLSFDIVHYHDFRSLNNFFLSNYFKKNNIPQIMSPYGSMNKYNKTVIKNIYDKLFGNKVINNINLFLAVNKVEQRYIENYTDKRAKILPNSINLENITHMEYNFREHYNLPNKKIILFLSRLNRMKNPSMVIESYKLLPDNVKSSSIAVIIGPDDGEAENLKKIVSKNNLKDHIFVIPKFVNNEKWEIYKQSDVFILTSNDQASPLVMLEAISQNLPVVTSETALKDTLDDKLGSIVGFNASDFAGAISYHLKSQRPTNGFEFIKTHYSVKQYVKTLNLYYRDIIS